MVVSVAVFLATVLAVVVIIDGFLLGSPADVITWLPISIYVLIALAFYDREKGLVKNVFWGLVFVNGFYEKTLELINSIVIARDMD